MSPLTGNVIFASNNYGFMFSLESFATQYAQKFQGLNAKTFAKVLWGNYFYNKTTKKFVKKSARGSEHRTFVSFILEPLYKILGYSVSFEKDELEPMLKRLGVYLKKEQFQLDTRSMLKIICKLFFGDSRSFVDMVVQHIPNP